jgi:putative hydrolase of the HAD superfamily
MATQSRITTLFLDVGGVLLTNGWGRKIRQQAAEFFKLDYADMEERHHLSFNTFEDGKLTLDQYLDQVIFFKPRDFSRDTFKTFIYDQTQAYPDMIGLMQRLKQRHNLTVFVVSNEGRELTAYRVKQFGLKKLVDAFVVSCYVHYRKPDQDIYRLALEIAQVDPEQVAYIDDRALFIQVASGLGIPSIQHIDLATTQAELAKMGITDD